ncbi:MFS transporter [Exophiala viscosa]|uniref:MFS transporter n=1 Tax=Exophiala viscosa TaxID=2486360 RepID=UPI00219799A0|nr:MFS transporter [Exophiala viscosa]
MGPTRGLRTDDKPEGPGASVSPTRYGTIVDAEAAKSSDTDMDAEFDGLSLYEKKVLLVDREIDAQGMGRYQWSVFFTCGAGYLLDLLWAQAFGLVVTPMQNEFGFGDEDLGTIFTAFSVGLTAGAFLWGILVDTVGRSAGFNYTVLISSIFGVWLGGSSNYNTVVVLTALTGIGIGGNIPVDTTICLECLPQSRRWLLPTLSIFQPIGVVACSAMAYAFIPKYSCAEDLAACSTAGAGVPCCSREDNWGWRYLMFTIGGITIAVFILRSLLFTFQESPKYLLYRGRDGEAINVLQYIARFNKRECGLTIETFDALSSDASRFGADDSSGHLLGSGADKKDLSMGERIRGELARFKPLFSSFAMGRLVILVWIIYAFDYWGFTIAGSFLPTILARKGRALGLGLRETYRSYIYIYTFGIPGVLAGSLIYGRRRTALLLSSALFGACLFAFTLVSDQASYIAINGLVYFFQSMFNGVLYGWTPEAFPAQVRGSACGISSFFGRLVGIVAPIAGSHMLAHSLNGVLYLAGAGVWVSTVAILLLPRKALQGQNH